MQFESIPVSTAAQGARANEGSAPSSVDGVEAAAPETPGALSSAAVASPAENEADAKEAKPDAKKESASARFAALAKKERGLVLKQQDWAAKKTQEEAALRAEREAFAKERTEYESFQKARANAKLDPVALLEAHGLTYDEVTEFVLNGKKPTGELASKANKDEIEALRKEMAEREEKRLAAEKEAAEARAREVEENFKARCNDFAAEHAEEYELLTLNAEKFYNLTPGDLVFHVIREHYEMTKQQGKPRILSEKEAAEKAEQYFEKLIVEATSSKKLQAKAAQPNEPQKRTEVAQSRTLTNGHTATAPAVASSPYSEAEAMRRAIAVLEGRK